MFRFDICYSEKQSASNCFFLYFVCGPSERRWSQHCTVSQDFQNKISWTFITKVSAACKVLTWCKKKKKSEAAAWEVWWRRSVTAHLIIIMRRTCCPTIPLACFCSLRDAGKRIITHFHWGEHNYPPKCRNPQNRIVWMPMSNIPFWSLAGMNHRVTELTSFCLEYITPPLTLCWMCVVARLVSPNSSGMNIWFSKQSPRSASV